MQHGEKIQCQKYNKLVINHNTCFNPFYKLAVFFQDWFRLMRSLTRESHEPEWSQSKAVIWLIVDRVRPLCNTQPFVLYLIPARLPRDLSDCVTLGNPLVFFGFKVNLVIAQPSEVKSQVSGHRRLGWFELWPCLSCGGLNRVKLSWGNAAQHMSLIQVMRLHWFQTCVMRNTCVKSSQI